MIFSSTLFLGLFLPVLLILYLAVPGNLYRKALLIVASLSFYAWGEPVAAIILVVMTAANFFIAKWLDCRDTGRRQLLALAIAVDLGILFFYKYFGFTLDNLRLLLPSLPMVKIALPIGISFYTFQIMSYTIDVYRKEVPHQKSFSNLLLYVSLFPQLIAGPIVRYQTIADTIDNRSVTLERVTYGLQRFIIGLAKKVLIADVMARVADTVFDTSVSQVPTAYCWVGAVAYMLQIYYDFSGYSDMAIGLGKIFNFDFLENFNYPYSALSVKDFWRRWHISLSTWFRDYLYIPLGGNRVSVFRTYLNMMIVFLLCGAWHGAAWSFVIWGIYHGIGLIAERAFLGKLLERLPRFFQHCYALLFVLVGWVIFRAESLSYAVHFLGNMFCGDGSELHYYDFVKSLDFIAISTLLVAISGIAFSFEKVGRFLPGKLSPRCMSLVLFLLFMVTFIFAMTSNFTTFIYFRF